jgi:hypothetical protein
MRLGRGVWICVALPASMTLGATPAPDTILFNGKIFTAERQQFIQALAIQDRSSQASRSSYIYIEISIYYSDKL